MKIVGNADRQAVIKQEAFPRLDGSIQGQPQADVAHAIAAAVLGLGIVADGIEQIRQFPVIGFVTGAEV